MSDEIDDARMRIVGTLEEIIAKANQTSLAGEALASLANILADDLTSPDLGSDLVMSRLGNFQTRNVQTLIDDARTVLVGPLGPDLTAARACIREAKRKVAEALGSS